MKKIKLITILITIILICSACGKTLKEEQKDFINRSESVLLNQKFEIIKTDNAKIKGLIYYKNYVKTLTKDYDITNIGTFVFKTQKTTNKFKTTFDKELKDTIKQLQSNNNVGTFKKEKLNENQTLYTSLEEQIKECSEVLVTKLTDINAVVVITGVSKKLEKEKALKEKSQKLLETLHQGKIRKKRDYIKADERNLLAKSQEVLKDEGFKLSLEPKSKKHYYNIKLSATKEIKENKGLYSALIIICSNKENILSKYNEFNPQKDLTKEKYLNLKKESINNKTFSGISYCYSANNGYVASLIAKNKNIIIKINYRQYKDINNNNSYKEIKKIFERIVKCLKEKD